MLALGLLLIATRRSRPITQGRMSRTSPQFPFHYSPGYRVYFQRRGDTIIILLCGGDKDTQARNIKTALQLADEWSE